MSESKLTSRDMDILSKVFQCFSNSDAMKVDTEKLAQIAGFSSGKSANTSWNVLKKKLLAGATVDGPAKATTPKKGRAKAAATNGDANDDNNDDDDNGEATPTKAAPKKRSKAAVKLETAEMDGGDADTEATPGAETPKKGRAGKKTTTATADGDDNDATTALATPKRKRGPNKPKDPTATPTKRAKKVVNANAGLPGDDITTAQGHGEKSIFGGDALLKKDDERSDWSSMDVDGKIAHGALNASDA